MPAADFSTLLLDADAMSVVLQDRLPQLRGARTCRIHQTRRRVSRKTEEQGAPYLGVVYELPAADAATPVDRWCYVKAYSRGASLAARDARAVHLHALDALAWTLPHDPALSQLAEFLDAGRVQSVLRHALAAADERTQAPTVAIVRHEPESHCTARFELTLHGRRVAAYGKAYADGAWSAAARRARTLWSSATQPCAFAIARPLAADSRLRALWQEEVRGTPLRAVLQTTQAPLWLTRVARALAQLQASALLGDTSLAPTELLARTTKQCRKLVRADASLAAALDPVLASLQRLPATDAVVAAHGDFHVEQMLCTGERVALFDFDNFAIGSPALDVADFASQVLTDAGLDQAQRISLARGFIASCLLHLPRSPRYDDLDWHLRALLLRKAYSFFVRHRAGWRERVRAAAALAARGLADLWPDLRPLEARRAA